MSTATAAIQVFRTVDNTTANIGFISNGKVNAAAVDAFCNAAVVGVISRNCFISRVFDQTTNACDIFNTIASGMPDYMVWPSHGGLPIFQKSFQGNTGLAEFPA